MSGMWAVLHRNEHKYVTDRLGAYIDRQLSVRERDRIKRHLETCAPCRQELETLLWSKNLLRQTPDVPLPRSFVLRKVDVAPQKLPKRRTGLFAAQWATAVVALLLVVVLFGDALSGELIMGGAHSTQDKTMMQEYTPSTLVVQQVIVPEQNTAPDEGKYALPVDTPPLRVRVDKEAEIAISVTLTAPVTMTVRETGPVGESEPVLGEAPPVSPTITPPPPPSTRAPQKSWSETQPLEEQPPRQAYAPADPSRILWRVAETGLGAALIGLLVVIWTLRRKT